MTYAIIETGGKQYRAEAGQLLDIEKVELEKGKTLKLDKVLFVSDGDTFQIGQPSLKGAVVEAEIVNEHRTPKVISFKYIRREAGAKTKIGHRQTLTRIKIVSIKKG